ncbi:MAG: hypothetical protein ISN29_01665 [Gammaproteobacteria bacterium AqS3]|nr:hypothetical protein [Gammaproteobacteria bacterium AqS3]
MERNEEVTLYDLKVALDAHEARCLEDKTEMKNDIKVLKADTQVLKADNQELKTDVKVLKIHHEYLSKMLDRLESRTWWIFVAALVAPIATVILDRLLG